MYHRTIKCKRMNQYQVGRHQNAQIKIAATKNIYQCKFKLQRWKLHNIGVQEKTQNISISSW